MQTQKPALGKGLASLFPNIPPPAPTPGVDASVSKDRIPGITLLNLDEIVPNPYQPRREFNDETIDELAQSIRVSGLIQPLIVRKVEKGYQLIAGERRFRASKLAGLKHVPVVVRKSTDKEALEMALIENIQREDLNCVDTALAYQQLCDEFSLTQEEIAQRVGKDRAGVANHLRILRLAPEILNEMKSGHLSFGHGKVLLSLEKPEMRMQLLAIILAEGMSVRDAELWIEARRAAEMGAPQHAASQSAETPLESRMKNLSLELTRGWNTRIELKGSEKKGKILIHYRTREDLDRILNKMQN